jgi:hypothetical protein
MPVTPVNDDARDPRAAGFKPAEPHLRLLLIALTLTCSWLAMQWVHEAGHVLGALATGGEVQRVVLHPLSISRTDLGANPRPLIVTWAGPLFGVLAPLTAWAISSTLRLPSAYLFRFFAGFCCVANGLYIGLGSFGHVGDCGDLLKHGAAAWQLWLFGVVSTTAGFVVWNRLGPRFGLGPAGERIRIPHCLALAVMTLLLAIAGTLL